jgi:hypothetical protein
MDFLIPEEKPKAPDFQFATVASVESNGVTLLFDGESEAGAKIYKCAAGVVLHAGDRVKVCRDSGTVVVEYAIGTPGSTPAEAHGIPAGGTRKQVLTKSSGTDYDANWQDPPVGVPDGGSENQMLTADNSGAPVWSTIRFRVASGLSGKIEYSIDGTTWKTVATE